jgi:hypothetical protein
LRKRKDLVEAVEKHFADTKLDYNKVISKFLKIKKDERQDDCHYLRKSARNQWNKEKQVRKDAARKEKYEMYLSQNIAI